MRIELQIYRQLWKSQREPESSLWLSLVGSLSFRLSPSLSVKHFYRTQVHLGSDLWVRMSVCPSLSPTPLWNLTELTLADDDTNPILTDNANRAIQGNVATQVTQPGGQLCKQCKWRHLMKATRLLESSRSRLDLLLTFLLHFQNKTKQNTKRQILNTNTKYRLPKNVKNLPS